jgi:chemotaxis response regulator CheB
LKRIRILLWGMPSMLRDIITDAITAQPDMEIVSRREAAAGLPETAESTNADVVILTREDVAEEDDELDDVLYGRTRRRVLQIFDQGRHGSLRELRPCQVPLGEMSPPRLLEAIRGSVGRTVGFDP